MRKGCASPGGCDDSVANGGTGCRLCDWAAKLPQPKTALEHIREQENPCRDGAPRLPLEGDRHRKNLAYRKRHRDGPFRGNA